MKILNKIVFIFLGIIFIIGLLYLLFLEIPTKLCKKKLNIYHSLKMNISSKELIKKFGNPNYKIKYWNNSKILYYIGCDKTFYPSQTLEKYNNKILKKSNIINEYGYLEFYFDEKDQLKSYIYCGEDSGSNKGGITGYMVLKRESNFNKIKIKITPERIILELFGEPDNIKLYSTIGKILEYYAIKNSTEDPPTIILGEQEGTIFPKNNKKICYEFFINKKGIIEAKENIPKHLYDSIYGKIKMKNFIKIKKKNERKNK